jgi:hypothetical protein
MPDDPPPGFEIDAETGRLLFALLNEIGIVAQLARTLFERSGAPLALPQFTVLNHLVAWATAARRSPSPRPSRRPRPA